MFALATTVAVLAASVAAAPHLVARTNVPQPAPSLGGVSLDNWGSLPSLSGFDNFYGSSNFCGNNNQQVVLQETVVCHSVEIEVIQQRLAVIAEFAKRIITEQICEVETQTIVFEQFSSSFGSFSDDLGHNSGRGIGYDRSVASHIGSLLDGNGDITSNDLGFNGSSIGGNLIVPSGGNWDASSSPGSVHQAQLAAKSAILASHSSSVNVPQPATFAVGK